MGVTAILFVVWLIWFSAHSFVAVECRRRKKQARLAEVNRAALPAGQRPTLIGMAGQREDVHSLRWTDVCLLHENEQRRDRAIEAMHVCDRLKIREADRMSLITGDSGYEKWTAIR